MPRPRSSSSRPSPGTTELLEVLDRVLDRGIVIDAEFTVTVVGLTLAGVEARIVVAGIETYLEHADTIAYTSPASWRLLDDALSVEGPPEPDRSLPRHRLRSWLDDDGAPPRSFGKEN